VDAHAQLFLDGDRPQVLLVLHDVRAQDAAGRRAQELHEEERTGEMRGEARRVAGGVAHALNNRLQIILGFANLLAEEALTGEQQVDLNEIVRAALEGAVITRQLLQFASSAAATAEHVELETLAPALVREIEGAMPLLTPPLLGHTEPVPTVRVDPGHLRYMLAYLVANARRAIRLRGHVTIAVRSAYLSHPQLASDGRRMENGGYGTVVVHDTGSGMSADVQHRLFEPFFTTSGIGEGNGLGLAAVQGLLRQNNGFLTFATTPGVGSSFTLWFPEAADAPTPWTVPPPVASAVTLHIILVEERGALRSVAARGLERVGYRVLQASTAHEALELLAHVGCPALVLIGESVNRRAPWFLGQLHGKWPSLPALMLSPSVETVISDHGPTVTTLAPPYSEYALVSRVQELLHPEEKRPDRRRHQR
jgi:two-component system, cell cycle sensor histidine kinase and response regulator CckA